VLEVLSRPLLSWFRKTNMPYDCSAAAACKGTRCATTLPNNKARPHVADKCAAVLCCVVTGMTHWDREWLPWCLQQQKKQKNLKTNSSFVTPYSHTSVCCCCCICFWFLLSHLLSLLLLRGACTAHTFEFTTESCCLILLLLLLKQSCFYWWCFELWCYLAVPRIASPD
jgi:hypothetical protein